MEDKEKNINEVILNRRSVRKFNASKSINHEDIMDIVKAGVYAPSGSNWQTQRFLIITSKEKIKQIISSKSQREKLETAAAIIMVFADTDRIRSDTDKEKYIWDLLRVKDCAASMQNMMLLATAKGIGSCWISFEERMNGTRPIKYKTIKEILKPYNIPEKYEVHDFLVLGYPLKIDEAGYAKGYGCHGFLNEKTIRRPIKEYIIGEFY